MSKSLQLSQELENLLPIVIRTCGEPSVTGFGTCVKVRTLLCAAAKAASVLMTRVESNIAGALLWRIWRY